MEQSRSTLEEQVKVVVRLLRGKQLDKNTPVFDTAIKWMKAFPSFIDQSLKEELKLAICWAFSIDEAELWSTVEGVVIGKLPGWESREDRLEALLPKGGWFEWYAEYTRYNEAPLSYHVFSSLCVLGAALGRRVWFDMGHFKIWPNYCVILIGPTGRVKKTTAADVAADLIREHALCPVLVDEPTPQAMISALKGCGHHFIYAPEMSLFFGKEKFKEGMVPKMLRMLDSPAVMEVETISRGKETVTDLAITFLGATTPSLLTTNMPGEVTSSGFMNRFMLVVERDTERVFPRPWKGKGKDGIDKVIKRLKHLTGEVTFTSEADTWWDAWYRERKRIMKATADDLTAEVLERMPGHVLRTAMLIHLVQCDDFRLCVKCLEVAKAIIGHVEKETPAIVQRLRQSNVNADAEYVYDMLVKLGGAADHSTLLRRVASKMNAQTFKTHIRTLEESHRVKIGKQGGGQHYMVIGEVVE